MSEIAWAAGFYDGEGSTSWTRPKVGGKWYLTVDVGQVRKEPLERFTKAVGIGKCRGPYKRPKKLKWDWDQQPHYQYRASGKQAHNVIALLWPWLSEPKREQYYSACETIETRNKERVS